MKKKDPRDMVLPDYILTQLLNWIHLPTAEKGPVQPVAFGGFLTAVLENNLALAVARADETNINLIPAIVSWLFNRAPAACWGSPENVRAWRFMREKS